MKLLWVGDVHVADSPPAKRVETYGEEIKAKLLEIREIANDPENEIDYTAFAGDIFHHKHPQRVSHRTVNWLCSYFAGFLSPVLILVGNHDITDGLLESLDKQPLGVIGNLDNVTLLKWDKVSLFNEATGKNVVLHPIPGVPGVTLKDYAVDVEEGACNIILSHQSIVPDLSKLPPVLQDKPFMHDSQKVADITDADVVLYGHEHGNHGIYARSGKLFVNLGSISRGSLNESDLAKEPQVFLLQIEEKLSGRPIKLKNVRPASEVFLLEEHVAAQEHRADIEDAISRLKDTRLSKFSIESIMGEIEHREDIDESARSVSLDLLEAVK